MATERLSSVQVFSKMTRQPTVVQSLHDCMAMGDGRCEVRNNAVGAAGLALQACNNNNNNTAILLNRTQPRYPHGCVHGTN
jgi:hypothetical protein